MQNNNSTSSLFSDVIMRNVTNMTTSLFSDDQIAAIDPVTEEVARHGMANSIIRSALAVVSVISSCTLIWMILRSKQRLSTIFHRILLGMSVADIFFSLGLAHFNFTAPRDDDYMVWNARGNQATCSAQGFISLFGGGYALMYSCALNLYYLAVVKYQKSDKYIKRRLEPFFHGFPLVYALVGPTTLLANKNINNGGGGDCYTPVYDPPHCAGYEDGEIPEGFTIPCGRGRDGALVFYYVIMFFTVFVTPIIIGVSLGMIYKAVLNQEKKISRYGAGALGIGAHQTNAANNDIGASTIRRNTTQFFGTLRRLSSTRRSSVSVACMEQTQGQQQSKQSRLVFHRALAYSIAYFLTWTFFIVGMGFDIAEVEWPTWIRYLTNIFNSLQGFFNFCVYLHPKVLAAKTKGGDSMTWYQALRSVFAG